MGLGRGQEIWWSSALPDFPERFRSRAVDFFSSPRECVSAIADAMQGKLFAGLYHMTNSWLPQRISQPTSMLLSLHRDISAGNILITYEGKGLLIDW